MATTQQVKDLSKNNNPKGKGGFGEHPEHQSPGGWKKENTISYQYNRFINMNRKELEAFAKTPKKQRTVAMDLAYRRVIEAYKSLPDMKEITDRTEGKAFQNVDITSDGERLDFGLSATQAEQLIRARANRSDS
jgi:hypothetical protein